MGNVSNKCPAPSSAVKRFTSAPGGCFLCTVLRNAHQVPPEKSGAVLDENCFDGFQRSQFVETCGYSKNELDWSVRFCGASLFGACDNCLQWPNMVGPLSLHTFASPQQWLTSFALSFCVPHLVSLLFVVTSGHDLGFEHGVLGI